jgi:hypothetical protein
MTAGVLLLLVVVVLLLLGAGFDLTCRMGRTAAQKRHGIKLQVRAIASCAACLMLIAVLKATRMQQKPQQRQHDVHQTTLV